jgi:hypothetical protein
MIGHIEGKMIQYYPYVNLLEPLTILIFILI